MGDLQTVIYHYVHELSCTWKGMDQVKSTLPPPPGDFLETNPLVHYVPQLGLVPLTDKWNRQIGPTETPEHMQLALPRKTKQTMQQAQNVPRKVTVTRSPQRAWRPRLRPRSSNRSRSPVPTPSHTTRFFLTCLTSITYNLHISYLCLTYLRLLITT